jgi:metal-dependent amidase/aminoacylase/carboxypeptidase family protein
MYVIGIADNQQVPVRTVALRHGTAFPIHEQFDIKIHERNSAQTQHSCLLAAAQLSVSLSHLVSRKTNPLIPSRIELLDLCSDRNSGPASASVSCLVTAFGLTISRDIAELVEKTTAGLCQAYGLDFEIETCSIEKLFSFDGNLTIQITKCANDIGCGEFLTDIEFPETTFIEHRRLFEPKPAAAIYYNRNDSSVADMSGHASLQSSPGVLLRVLSRLITNG